MSAKLALYRWRRSLALLILGIALSGVVAGDAQEPAKDTDSLPDGATLRLGSLRWRHGEPITFVAMPADGKTVLTAGQDSIVHVWDRETGKEIRHFDAPDANAKGVVRNNFYMQGLTRAALSKDGKLLAVASPSNVQVWDVDSGKSLHMLKGATNGVASLTFSPDGAKLVVRGVSDRVAHVYDTKSGKELRQLKSINPNGKGGNIFGGAGDGTGVAISADNKLIALSELEFDGMRVSGSVTTFELDSGKQLKRIESQQNGISSLAISPDGKTLVFNTYNGLHYHDMDTGNEIRKTNGVINTGLLLYSPDGNILAVKGRDYQVRLYDAKDGKQIRALNDTAQKANAGFVANSNGAPTTDLVFSADGKSLVLGGQHMPRFFDVATGKEQTLTSGIGHRGAVTAMTMVDAKTLQSRGADGTLRTWDLKGQETCNFAETAGTSAVRFAPSGRFVALGNNDGSVHILDVIDGKEKRQFKAHQGSVATIAYSADGSRLATRGGYDGLLRVFDAEKGTEIKQIMYQDVKAGANNGVVFIRTINGQRDSHALAFSPDGKTLATFIGPQQVILQGRQQMQPDSNCLRLYDVASGKEIRRIAMQESRAVYQLLFSLDGRLLISENTDKTVSLWEIASGQERARFGDAVNNITQSISTTFVAVNGNVRNGPALAPLGVTVAVSPDGSLIATTGANQSVKIYDASLGKAIGSLRGHSGAITSLDFTPDGKTLITGSNDTTLLVWDLTRIKRERAAQVANLEPKELERLWTDLIGSDAGKAGQSVQKLIAAPGPAVAFLKEHIKPATPADVAKVNQWIKDLDSTNFKKRALSAKELEKIGELAIPALQKVLAANPSLETRRRLEPLLDELTGSILTPEQIRVVRVIEVLDKIGTSESRQLLQHLATGAPGSLITRHAQEALARSRR